MSLTFEQLREHLPPNSLEFVGVNQLKLNLTQLTQNDDLTLQSPLLEGIAKLLESLVELTEKTNQERAEADPPSAPIVFASRSLLGTMDAPVFRFTIDLRVDPNSFIENLKDPLE